MSEAVENYLQIKTEEIKKQMQVVRFNKNGVIVAIIFSFFCYALLFYLSYIDKISILEHVLGVTTTFLFTMLVIMYCRVTFFERMVKVQNIMLDFIHSAMEYSGSFAKIKDKEKKENKT